MLRELISQKEKELMFNYICSNGGMTPTVEIDYLLRFWAQHKEVLFKLLDNKLIYSKEIVFEKQEDELFSAADEILCLQAEYPRYYNPITEEEKKRCKVANFMRKVKEYVTNHARPIGKEDEEEYYWCFSTHVSHNLMCAGSIAHNAYCGRPFKIETEEGHAIIATQGCKLSRLLGKLAKHFEIDGYEEFRILASQITNQKKLTGKLCLSIHPLDFFTMSDNQCGWDTCMNWMNANDGSGGEYCRGTISMMNSPIVVVAYLDSDKPMTFECMDNDEEYTWSNKKWRQLFIVSQSCIVGVKSYPYYNDEVSAAAANLLRELAEKNFGWTYDIEDKRWNRNSKIPEIRVHFTTSSSAMYCDFGSSLTSYAFFNSELCKDIGVIDYSGIEVCMCCGETQVSYSDESRLFCENCYPYKKCSECGSYEHEDNMICIGENTWVCSYCYDEYYVPCSICGEPVYASEGHVSLTDEEEQRIDDICSAYIRSHCNTKARMGLLPKLFNEPYNITWSLRSHVDFIDYHALTADGLATIFDTTESELNDILGVNDNDVDK